MKFKILLLTVILFLSCRESKPIKVGYISNLSGRQAELGIRGRDGVLMAINEVNELGGINNRMIELVVKDHLGDKDYCYQLTRELVEEDVEVIIGPMTSNMASAVIEGTKDSNVLIISPTVSTDQLTGIDDNFIRVISASSSQGIALATVMNTRNEENIAVVYDSTNLIYAQGVIGGLSKTATSIDEIYTFKSKEDIPDLIEKLFHTKADSIVFISTGIDAAQILQNLSKVRELPSIYGSSWVKLSNVAQHGGKIINGMIICDIFQSEVKSDRELEFYNKYKKIYNSDPTLPGIYSYEAINLFMENKRKQPNKSGLNLKKDIIDKAEYRGISTDFSFNSYGDVMRKQSLLEVIDGEYRIYAEY